MELNPHLFSVAVADSHCHAIGRGMHAKSRRRIGCAERMIATDPQRIWETNERPCSVVLDHRGLAVDNVWRTNDLAPALQDNSLVAEANAE